MKKFFSPLFFFTAVLAMILSAGDVRAVLAPQIYLSDLDTGGNTYKAGAAITGSVRVKNYESSYRGDLSFQFQLLAKAIDGVPRQIIDQKTSQEKFELAADADVVKFFNYALPANLPGGDVIFRVQLITGRGEEINWIDAPLAIGGEGIFLELNNARIIKNGEALSNAAGVYYDSGETVNIQFDVKNNTDLIGIVFPRVITYKRNPSAEAVGTFDFDGITINSNSARTLNYELPKLTAPETYSSEVRLYDSKTKLPVSNALFFRWIISGINAKILYVDADKSDYSAGETAQINIAYTGPADNELSGDKAVITTMIVDEKGDIAGRSSQDISLGSGEITMEVDLSKNVVGAKVETEISNVSGMLDEYDFNLSPGEVDSHGEESLPIIEQRKFSEDAMAVIFVAIAAFLAFLVAVNFFIRKKSLNKN